MIPEDGEGELDHSSSIPKTPFISIYFEFPVLFYGKLLLKSPPIYVLQRRMRIRSVGYFMVC
jgi:hypothetical protein